MSVIEIRFGEKNPHELRETIKINTFKELGQIHSTQLKRKSTETKAMFMFKEWKI